MRDIVRDIVRDEVITLPQLAELLGISPVLIYRYVITEAICEHERIGKSHVIIDREDLDIVRERVTKSKEFKINRKKA